MKRITFLIQRDGNVNHVDSVGFGSGCQAATQDIEKLLGVVDESSRALTDSYYQETDPLVLKNET